MLSLKSAKNDDLASAGDDYVVWAGNKLPKYLWEQWREDLKPLGVTWQKFMRILRYRTDIAVRWYQGSLPWPDFIKKIDGLIQGPIGRDLREMPAQDLSAFQLPALSDWQPFERLCRGLWALLWNNAELQLNGRGGQPQAGVDVYGNIDSSPSNIGGVQCKRRDNFADDSLTRSELRKIVEEAKKFTPKLTKFVVAYTGRRDANLQEEARLITQEHAGQGLFSVSVFSWDDIVDELGSYPDLAAQYFPFLVGVNTTKVEELQLTADAIFEGQTENAQRLATVVQKTDTIHSGMNSLTEMLKDATDPAIVGQEFHAELDEIRDLLNSQLPKEALDRITKLEKRVTPGADPIVKFRLITNKAAALASLGKDKEAGPLFIEAYQYNPDDEKALCNKALGYLLLNQKSDAAKFANDALQKNPLSPKAHEILVYCAPAGLTIDEIADRVPQSLRHSEGICYAIAQIAKERKDLPTAIKWLELAEKNADGTTTPDLSANLASTLLMSLGDNFDVLNGIQISAKNKKILERAVDLLTEAISVFERSETLKFRTDLLTNRSTAYKLLGKSDEALADINTALKLRPNDHVIAKQKAFMLHEAGNSAEALTLLEAITGKEDVPEVPLLLAGIAYEIGDTEKTVKILQEDLARGAAPADIQLEEKRLLIQAYVKLEQYEQARDISNELRSANPVSILDLVGAARIEKLSENINKHPALLDEARGYINDSTPRRDIFALADELYASQRYADAWPLYERLVDINAGTSLTRNLIFSYYKGEQYEKALEAARAVPAKFKDTFIYEIEVSILDSMGDLDGAIEASQRYLSDHPEDLQFKIKLAVAWFRKGDFQSLDEFLQTEVDLNMLPPDEALQAGKQLAGLYSERGMSERALDTVYWLRKRFVKEADAHLAYFVMFMNREKHLDDKLEASVVAVDTAVRLDEAGGKSFWYVIEENPIQPAGMYELTPDDQITKDLMGKSVGEEVVFDKGMPSEVKLKVAEIKSKYVHALHETMEVFPHLFRGNSGLKRFSVRTNGAPEETQEDVKSMMDIVGSRDDWILQVQKLYEEGKMTIGTFANLIGKNVTVVWGGLISKPSVGVRCAVGTLEERQKAFELIRNHKEIVVDITALLTCGSMDRLDLVKQSFNTIYITQSTLDTLLEEISEKGGMGAKGFTTVWKENGQFYRSEITEDDIKNQIGFLKKIQDWVSANCVKSPVKEVLKLSHERRSQLEQVIGKSFLDSILLAKEKGCPIYSDDVGTRAIAQNELEVPGIWTQVVAIIAQEKGLIDADQLEKINIDLIIRNYRHTTISAATLLKAAEQANWSNGEPLLSVLNTLSQANIDLKSAVLVAIDFCYLLWKQPLLDDQRQSIVFAVLDTIARKGSRPEILRMFAALVPIRFRLIPLAGQHLLKVIAAWRSIKS